MKIGIIGTGQLGSTLGSLWAKKNYAIMFGSRTAQRGEQLAAEVGHGAKGGTIAAAAEFADVLLLAVPWYAFTDVERVILPLVDGKILIDCINPLRSTGSLAIGHKWSAGEEIAKTLHRARVVKAFNHLHPTALNNPHFNGQAASLFYCSNHDDAGAVVVELAEVLGLAPVHAGPLKNSRLIEPLAALWLQLAYTMHNGTEFALNLVQRSSE